MYIPGWLGGLHASDVKHETRCTRAPGELKKCVVRSVRARTRVNKMDAAEERHRSEAAEAQAMLTQTTRDRETREAHAADVEAKLEGATRCLEEAERRHAAALAGHAAAEAEHKTALDKAMAIGQERLTLEEAVIRAEAARDAATARARFEPTVHADAHAHHPLLTQTRTPLLP